MCVGCGHGGLGMTQRIDLKSDWPAHFKTNLYCHSITTCKCVKVYRDVQVVEQGLTLINMLRRIEIWKQVEEHKDLIFVVMW